MTDNPTAREPEEMTRESAAIPRKYRSEEEGAMRCIVSRHLRETIPGARIIHEFPLRYSTNSLDMAAVTETEIVGVEIKSSRDVIDRLDRQLRAFAPICSRIIVALAPNWNEKLPTLTTKMKRGARYQEQHTEAQSIITEIREYHIETWTCCYETDRFERTNGGYCSNKAPWAARMLDVLHVSELKQIVGVPARNPTHDYLVQTALLRLTQPKIIRSVCAALRGRQGFAALSDAPIEATATNMHVKDASHD